MNHSVKLAHTESKVGGCFCWLLPLNETTGSKGMYVVISELCYKGIILQNNYMKMTILWSFSYNSFVKFHGKYGEPNIQICVILRYVIMGTALHVATR